MFLQGIRRKLLAHARTVQHTPRAVVDEGSPVDAPFLRVAQYGVDALLFKLGNKPILVISALQHGKNGTFRHVCQFPVLNLRSGTYKLLLHGFIACGLPEERGLERVAHLVAPAVRDGIDQPVIFPSAHVTPRFLHRQVIDGKERTVFAHRLETVLPVQSFHGVAYLFLHITCRCVHLA